MILQLAGLGAATPLLSIEQSDAADRAARYGCGSPDEHRRVTVLYRRSGVKTRGSVLLEPSPAGQPPAQSFYSPARSEEDRGPTTSQRLAAYEREAPLLAERACALALADAGQAAAEVTHLVTVSCSGFCAPGFDLALFPRLGLPAEAARTHIGFMGCHGALNGLRVARAFAAAQPRACVLLCAVELCSLHYQYGFDPQQIVANSLFADGAAAAVVTAGEGGSGQSPAGAWRLAASDSAVLPDSADLMSWRIGDHGFQMTLSPRVPDFIAQRLEPWLVQWLARQGMTLEDIRSWAIHPGGPRILRACAEGLRLDPACLETSQAVLAEHGNMSSPTILFILDRLRRAQAPRPCLMLGFGPGLTVEAALLV